MSAWKSLLASAFLAVGNVAGAVEIETTYLDISPFMPKTLQVSISGTIESGDTEKLRVALDRYRDKFVQSIALTFSSSGGSLVEGIGMGRLIASLEPVTTSGVDGSCASSCVYAYLGADFRYLTPTARIGVHKFFMTSEVEDSHGAMATSQDLSALIISYMRDQGVDPVFFSDIVSAAGDSIYWVPHSRLAEAGVITQGARSQNVEYKNISGTLVLEIRQDAEVGDNVLQLACGNNGVLGVAYLAEPPMAFQGELLLNSNEIEYPVIEQSILGREDGIIIVGFLVPLETASSIMNNSSIGAKIFNGDHSLAYGFLGSVSDFRVQEVFANCSTPSISIQEARTVPPATLSALSAMSHHFDNHDMQGSDFDNKGLKGVTLEQCAAVCMQLEQCRAVSYVKSNSWCWPKSNLGILTDKSGVITLVK